MDGDAFDGCRFRFWSFFCVLSGLFMISTGALTLYYAIKVSMRPW